MDVVDALVSHHGVLRQLYLQSETNPEIFEELMRQLVVHHTMEERYFYELLEGFPQARRDALEAVNEHHIIELIIKDAERFPRDHERFSVKVESLGEYTTHHLDEEEAQIFPLARQLFTLEDLNTLGRLFTEAKDKLLGVVLPDLPASLSAKRPKKAKGGNKGSPGFRGCSGCGPLSWPGHRKPETVNVIPTPSQERDDRELSERSFYGLS
ncbi:MAG: hemerythrin domain-containing protein [Syntrophobacteraceae bacterium]|jgi:hemerythrin-like domain-containing protein|nr:hemerythrin domain-containing protein [Syntrophobacteraceae bacterium]